MATIRIALVAALAAAWASATSSRELSTKAAIALPRDDICAEPSMCSLSALQVAQKRQGWNPVPQDEEGALGWTASGYGLTSQRSHPWFLNQTEYEQALLIPDIFPNAKAGSKKVQTFWDTWFAVQTGITNELPFCQTWTAYFWPQMAFWAKEIIRRKDTVKPDDHESLKKVQKFAYRAAWLGSILHMDPRRGAPWESDAQPFFKEVAARPSTDYDMPQLPDILLRTSMQNYVWGLDANMWWYTNLWCDTDYWRQEFLGNKVIAEGDVCWDEVPFPNVSYGFLGAAEPDLPAWPADFDPYSYPEYRHCQEHDITLDMINRFCPFSGHVQRGVADEGWGTGPPTREGKESVLQCQKGLGELMYTKVNLAGVKVIGDKGLEFGPLIKDGPPPAQPPSDFDPENFRQGLSEMWNVTYFRNMRADFGMDPNFNPFNTPLASPFFQAMKLDFSNGETMMQSILSATVQLTTNTLRAAAHNADASAQPAIQNAIAELGRLRRTATPARQ